MTRYHLFPHGGSRNHGCEAIVRTTRERLGTDAETILYSHRPDEDRLYGLDRVVNRVVPTGFRPFSPAHFASAFHSKILKDKLYFMKRSFRSLYDQAFGERDVIMSIGGDNYCYPNMAEKLYYLDSLLHREQNRMVLWGCSIEPELFSNPYLLKDLKHFTALTPRESLTYEAMCEAGFGAQAVMTPDPAFLLAAEERPLPTGFAPDNTVGINFSPLIIKRETAPGIIMESVMTLVQDIIEDSDFQIALIPHVTWAHEDDRKVLRQVYEHFAPTGRVVLIEDADCRVLKGYIQRCRLFIGARTHATIAAYSTGVPTLAIGYSVKSRGIARDLFGTADGYVLPVAAIDQPGQLSRAFALLVEREDEVRRQLLQVLPAYRKRVYEGTAKVRELLEAAG